MHLLSKRSHDIIEKLKKDSPSSSIHRSSKKNNNSALLKMEVHERLYQNTQNNEQKRPNSINQNRRMVKRSDQKVSIDRLHSGSSSDRKPRHDSCGSKRVDPATRKQSEHNKAKNTRLIFDRLKRNFLEAVTAVTSHTSSDFTVDLKAYIKVMHMMGFINSGNYGEE